MAFAEDITGTGRLDIISSGFGDVSWWENVKGDGSTWIRPTITCHAWTAQSITVGDINGDGKPDLFSFAPMASTVTWYENSGGANPTFTPHTISFPAGAGTVSLGDLNGDGRADAIITQEFGSAISWYMNWDGQSLMPNSTPPQPSSSTSETSSPETNLASLAFALPISGPGSLGGPVATLNASSGSQVSSNSASSFRLISAAANQDLGFHLVTVQDASSAMKTTLTPSRPLELDDSVDFWNNSFFFPAAKTGKQLI